MLVILTLLKGYNNQEKILIPVGTAMIIVAAVKYARVKQTLNKREPIEVCVDYIFTSSHTYGVGAEGLAFSL